MEKNKRTQIDRVLAAMNKSIRKIYEEAVAKKHKLPVSHPNDNIIYIDPQTVLNK
jgi:hypothetical protein